MTKKKWSISIVVVAIVAGAIFYFAQSEKPSSTLDYQKNFVTLGDLQVKILSTGTVAPDNRLEIKPPIAGRVEEIYVSEGQYIHKGQKLALMSSTERAALLDAARAKGPSEIKRWEEFYQAAPILAPINGTIILRNVEPGQTVGSGDALLVMSDRLTVKAQVDETDIAEIKLKQNAEIVLDAYPSNVIPAHVFQIAYDAKTVNNVTTYTVDVLPDETPTVMKSGMTANVMFFASSKKNILRVATSAVNLRDGHSYVLLPPAKRDGKPTEKEIHTGLTDGRLTEVIDGLIESETVLAPMLKTDTKGTSRAVSNPFSPFSGRRMR